MQYYTLKSKSYPERVVHVVVLVFLNKSINDFMSFRRPLNCL